MVWGHGLMLLAGWRIHPGTCVWHVQMSMLISQARWACKHTLNTPSHCYRIHVVFSCWPIVLWSSRFVESMCGRSAVIVSEPSACSDRFQIFLEVAKLFGAIPSPFLQTAQNYFFFKTAYLCYLSNGTKKDILFLKALSLHAGLLFFNLFYLSSPRSGSSVSHFCGQAWWVS